MIQLSCENNDEIPPFNVLYQVTFTASWSSSTHPTDFPNNAHFSPMVGMTHNAVVDLFTVDSLATPGIKEMAETGATSPLDDEISLKISRGNALDVFIGSSFDSPGMDIKLFGLEQSHPYISIVSMIAPSPDWFVGLNNLKLYDNGSWVQFMEVDAVAYDAGTDSGNTYAAANSPTSPRQNITKIGTQPIADGNGVVVPLGTFRFERIQ